MCKEKENSEVKLNEKHLQKGETKYLMKLKNLLERKRRGDWDKVARQVGISRENAMMAFRRIHSKYHYEVVAALEGVIEKREEKISV